MSENTVNRDVESRPRPIRNNASVFLVVVGDDKRLLAMLDVGSALMAKLVRTHAQLEDYPLSETDAPALPGLGQSVYLLRSMDYLHSIAGAMIKLSYIQQLELREWLLKLKSPDCYLVVSG